MFSLKAERSAHERLYNHRPFSFLVLCTVGSCPKRSIVCEAEVKKPLSNSAGLGGAGA